MSEILESACKTNYLDIVKQLVEVHDVKPTTHHLYLASLSGSDEIVKYLLGQKLEEVCPFNKSVNGACSANRFEIVKLLVKDKRFTLPILSTKTGGTSTRIITNNYLHDCLQNDNPGEQLVEFLIDLGVDVNHRNWNDMTPLNAHIYRGKPNYDIVKLLIEANTDLSIGDYRGNTPLHNICYSKLDKEDKKRIIILLLENGADRKQFNRAGSAPGHYGVLDLWKYDIARKKHKLLE